MPFTKKYIFLSCMLAIVYLFVIICITDFSSIITLFVGNLPLILKIKVFSTLLLEFPITLPPANVVIILLNAIITGVTAALVIERIALLKKMGNIHVVTGGSWMLAIVSGGCVSCGLPVLSLFGLTGILLYLPFRGEEIPYITCGLLCISLFLLVRQRRKDMTCEFPEKI